MTMLDEYGFRGALELDVATPRYRENPPLVASMLVAARGKQRQERSGREIHPQPGSTEERLRCHMPRNSKT